jgi:hypothetical protein
MSRNGRDVTQEIEVEEEEKVAEPLPPRMYGRGQNLRRETQSPPQII